MYISLALYCVVPEGFHTSLKPEEALIYLYDGCMVRMPYLESVQAMGSVWCLKLLLAKTTWLYRTILDVDESLFCLKTIVFKPSRPTQ